MPLRLYIAPPGAGKTQHCLGLAVRAARGLARSPYVCVSGTVQARSWRRRLTEAEGGYLGIHIGAMRGLYAACLRHEARPPVELGDALQYRLLRALLDRLPLTHYARLVRRPGFISCLQGLVAELKEALVSPAAFARAVEATGAGPRLEELAAIYAAYEDELARRDWVDAQGLGQRALRALRAATGTLPAWDPVIVDGYEALTPLQVAVLRALADRGAEVVVALTGEWGEGSRASWASQGRLELAIRHFGAQPLPLPGLPAIEEGGGALDHLRRGLFRGGGERVAPAEGEVSLVAAPGRTAEVRAALRWLKARLRESPDSPGRLALVARHVEPYRAAIVQVAAEYGLPVRVSGGLPLGSSPAVAALLDLLRLLLPTSADDPRPALPRRGVVEAWRSPYYDWGTRTSPSDPTPVGIAPSDAQHLDAAARAGRVIRGLSQWEEALGAWVRRGAARVAADEDDEPDGRDGHDPAADPLALQDTFRRFVARMEPPPAGAPMRAYVAWVEELIGPDPLAGSDRDRARRAPDTTSLGVVRRIREARDREGGRDRADADIAALQRLKDVLRGLVWAEDALGLPAPSGYAEFVEELAGAVEAMSFEPPAPPDRDEIQVAGVEQALGAAFDAVAVVGMAEGEFPATLGDDPLLSDADRHALREGPCALPLEPVLQSYEEERFRRIVCAARRRLLLTRPRLSETGALWAESPFWEEVVRLVGAEPRLLTSESVPEWEEVCSWSEALERLARGGNVAVPQGWRAAASVAARVEGVRIAAQVLAARHAGCEGPLDGGLADVSGLLERRYGPEHVWSASRLETYRACPFAFFVGSVLGLEPRVEPAEGLDPRQLGNVYHRLLERAYRRAAERGDCGREALLEALEAVADEVLDEAPAVEGFRETAWWLHTRAEIVENVRRSIQELCALDEDCEPLAFEARFFEPNELVVEVDGTTIRVHGLIDRVDRTPCGGVRVIDYKTAGKNDYTRRSVLEGRKLQLPLYALAARDALGLGEPVEGFYWHVRQAERSPVTLGGLDGGPQAAIDAAVRAAAQAVLSVRAGHFPPSPPRQGCPGYCAAVEFCWHYRSPWH